MCLLISVAESVSQSADLYFTARCSSRQVCPFCFRSHSQWWRLAQSGVSSVKAGAGINDDGSGTAGLLEIVDSLWYYRVKNKVRFAWWGAEENGLLGSEYYTAQLSDEELNKVAIYNNFDMIG